MKKTKFLLITKKTKFMFDKYKMQVIINCQMMMKKIEPSYDTQKGFKSLEKLTLDELRRLQEGLIPEYNKTFDVKKKLNFGDFVEMQDELWEIGAMLNNLVLLTNERCTVQYNKTDTGIKAWHSGGSSSHKWLPRTELEEIANATF